jgi:basic amino acid/polyamine antiporter, APA family
MGSKQVQKNNSSLHACLTTADLIFLGIGAIIGAGVFVLTGVVAASTAGPAIIISYLIAGAAAMFSAFSYAELATSVGGCGSAYNYAFHSFGKFIAWLIGWNLIFEYGLSVSTVAIGWAGYVKEVLLAFRITVPTILSDGLLLGGPINILAVLIILVLTLLLCLGLKETARFNAAIVIIKLITILIFIATALANLHPHNWKPFLPFGWPGVIQGAALVFFAYIGFDALSTAAEEAITPQRSIPIGILASMGICTLIYIVVAALLTGIVPYQTLNVSSPVASAMFAIGYPIIAGLISAGAIAGLTTVMLVMFYGLTRIFLAMARDGLFPGAFACINEKTRTPLRIIITSGIIMALIAGYMPISRAAELVNIGTLTAFSFVCAGTITLRWRYPDMKRPFKLPYYPFIPLLGILFCVYLMLNLPAITWWRFLSWLIIGVGIYFIYGKNRGPLSEKFKS